MQSSISVTHSHFQAASSSALNATDPSALTASLDLMFLLISQSEDSEAAFAEYNSHVSVVPRIVELANSFGARSPELTERLERLQALVGVELPSVEAIAGEAGLELEGSIPLAMAAHMCGEAGRHAQFMGSATLLGTATYRLSSTDAALVAKVVDLLPNAHSTALLAMGATRASFDSVMVELFSGAAALSAASRTLVAPLAVHVVDKAPDNGSLSVVLVYPEAHTTLGRELRRQAPTAPAPLAAVTHVLADAAAGLAALHAAGFVHGAVHAHNVMVADGEFSGGAMREWLGDATVVELIPTLKRVVVPTPAARNRMGPVVDVEAFKAMVDTVLDAWYRSAEDKTVAIRKVVSEASDAATIANGLSSLATTWV